MRKRACGLVVVVSVLLVASAAALDGTPPVIVSASGGDFVRIQDAIDAAEIGDVIVVRTGTYRENLMIGRPLMLLAEEDVFLEPDDVNQPAIAVEGTQDVTIQGLGIRMAAFGIDVSRSSCTISNCSISAIDTGIRIVAFDSDAVSILNTILRGSRQGTGVMILGAGRALLAQCGFSRLSTGVLFGSVGTGVVQGCVLEGCYEAIVVSNTMHAVLIGNAIRGNHANGVRLDPVPFAADEGALRLTGNLIEDNGRWGMTLCGIDGTDVAASFGRVLGAGNVFSGNGNGPVCPVDLPLPEGFGLP